MRDGLPDAVIVTEQIESGATRRLTFDTGSIAAWDSALVSFLLKVLVECGRRDIEADQSGFPDGVRRLITLATAVPEAETRPGEGHGSLIARLGVRVIRLAADAKAMVTFTGEVGIAMVRLARGKARFRRSDFTLTIQECGAQALGIVSLIGFLIGLILGFIGATQLQKFGAEIYVANLVGIGMAREMAAVMTAIIMAGRTGAAFAAQLGTMTVNEEIDALKSLAISPMEFLVLPRMMALALMMPLLCLYAIVLGALGGALVASMLGISLTIYFQQLIDSVTVTDVAVGVVKASVFGVIVAFAGCLRGMQCGRSAASVGAATTSAVVTSIVLVICSDAAINVILTVLGI